MTERSMRRAQERRAKKLARKQDIHPTTQEAAVPEISLGRRAANRENAQLSTGPRTGEGKACSSVNAGDEAAVVSEPKTQALTALTGRTVLLPSDDAAVYQHHLERYLDEFEPVTERETVLAQSIADTEWRLLRIPALEMAIYARGRTEEPNPGDKQTGFTDLATFLKYEKQLRNLQLQESRLRRYREKDLAELKALQEARIAEVKEQLKVAATLYTAAQHDGQPWNPADHGFEFSLDDVKDYLKGVRATQLYRESMKQANAAA